MLLKKIYPFIESGLEFFKKYIALWKYCCIPKPS